MRRKGKNIKRTVNRYIFLAFFGAYILVEKLFIAGFIKCMILSVAK